MTLSEKEPSSFRLIATLGVAGLASGVLLVGIYLVTLPTIMKNNAEALQAAVLRVVPGSEKVEAFVLNGSKLEPYKGAEGTIPEGEAVYAGVDKDGVVKGYAVPADGPGFMDTIKLLYGYDPAKKAIVGMEILDSRETPGLGDKIIADPGFHKNFEELLTDPSIVAVKHGTKTAPNQIDCISGATISSKAVSKILDKSTKEWRPRLDAKPVAANEESPR